MRNVWRLSLVVSLAGSLILLFQNCATGNDIDPRDLSSVSTSPGPSVDPGPSEVKIVNNSGVHSWSNGTYAKSCRDYRNPTAPYLYDGAVGDGTYTITLNGTSTNVYCDMSTDGGGYTMIANVPPAPNGNWEYNVSTLGTANLPSSLSVTALVTPANVNAALSYTEVLFLDSGLGNWFVVDPASTFYTKNYPATCGLTGEVINASFSARASNGATSLYAWFSNQCPNTADTITTSGASCVGRFINFDSICGPAAGTQIRVFVR